MVDRNNLASKPTLNPFVRFNLSDRLCFPWISLSSSDVEITKPPWTIQQTVFVKTLVYKTNFDFSSTEVNRQANMQSSLFHFLRRLCQDYKRKDWYLKKVKIEDNETLRKQSGFQLKTERWSFKYTHNKKNLQLLIRESLNVWINSDLVENHIKIATAKKIIPQSERRIRRVKEKIYNKT